ncbi:PREDICTED: protein DYAD [Tarenaya hassleriana]|uniref:protein DYAD n=1 Tax=Tarenaya hassleriana TaxID=28532 RepID=UPI00053C5C12|nr:PREDICTED: protein DYAD [Tarenaya hassleriana]
MIELEDSAMPELVISKQISSDGEKEDEGAQTSTIRVEKLEIKKESSLLNVKLENDIEPLVTFGAHKRKRLTRSHPKGAKFCRTAGQKENGADGKKNRLTNCAARWSAKRFKSAEQNMMDIMKEKGASFDKRISRQELRTAARQLIGDTGLLDHLLKHIDGKVTPSGVERFRRCYNTDGTLEYWLENADLVKIKREAGVPDTNWVPPSWWKDAPGESAELKLLKEDVAKMKSEIEELLSQQKLQEQADANEKMYKDLVSWRAKTDQQITKISNSLTSTQGIFKELISWKDKAEQQLLGISNSLNSLRALNDCATFSPAPERWEDWFQNTNLGDILGDGFEPLFGSADFINALPGAVMQEPFSVPQKPSKSPFQDVICFEEQPLVNSGMQTAKRDASGTYSQDNDNMAPDSSTTTNSKSDIDTTTILSQEMLELVAWKANVEQQLTEMSNAVIALQGRC